MADLLKKEELVAAVAEETNLTKADVTRVLAALQDNITKAVIEGKQVKLPGFLAFESRLNAARTMRNPSTGEPIQVAEKKVVKVRPLTAFADTVKNS